MRNSRIAICAKRESRIAYCYGLPHRKIAGDDWAEVDVVTIDEAVGGPEREEHGSKGVARIGSRKNAL